jgi:hypothetical protein
MTAEKSPCSLSFSLPGKAAPMSIQDLRQACEQDPTIDLSKQLNGAKMTLDWPHRPPVPTGDVRTKLIHARMHKQVEPERVTLRTKGDSLANLSSIFTLLITIPAVAFSLYWLCRWFEFSDLSSKLIGIFGGIASFFVELILLLITQWKQERHLKKMQGSTTKPKQD